MNAAPATTSRIAAAGLLVFPPLAAGWLNTHAADWVMSVFGGPAAHLAALMMGAPCETASGIVRMQVGSLVVDITAACAGAGFFSILWSFFYFLRLREAECFPRALRCPLLGWILLGLCAFPIAILANACRICAAVFIFKTAHPHFDGRIDALAHEAAGIIVFLCCLTLLAALVRRLRHDNETPAAS